MNKCLLLTKIFLKTNNDNLSQKNSKKKFQLNKVLMYILVVVAFIPLALMLGEMVSAFYDGLAQINQQGMILGIGFALSSIIILFFGVFYAINTMYFSSDVESILPLPFKPWEIVTAKFVTVLVYEYLTEAIFVLPLIISYGMKSGEGIAYYIYSLIIFLTIPIIPLAFASILVMIIMSFTNIAKNKDRFRKISGLVGVLVIVLLNAYIQKVNQSVMDPKKVNEMISTGNNGFINVVTKVFPTAKFAAIGAINSRSLIGLINILIFLVITILIMTIFVVLGQNLYFKGAIGLSETTSKGKKLSLQQLDKSSSKQSVLMAYTKKELRILFRTPVYFYNCVIMNFLWPIFFIIPMAVNSNKGLGQLKEIGNIINNPSHAGILIAGAFSLMIFVGGSNGITSTAISREGKNIYVNKYLPTAYRIQIMAKVLCGVLMGVMSEVIFIVVAVAMVGLNVKMAMIIFVISTLAVLYINMVGIIIDIYHPKLNWDNENQAVKQNFNVFFEMLISIASIIGLMVVVVKFEFSLLYSILFILVVFGLISLIAYKIITTKGEEKFGKLGD